MCLENESGKKHARRWLDKARVRPARDKRERPIDIRQQLRSRDFNREIRDGKSIAVASARS